MIRRIHGLNCPNAIKGENFSQCNMKIPKLVLIDLAFCVRPILPAGHPASGIGRKARKAARFLR